MNVNYLSKFMFVNYNDKGFFQTTILLETNNGIIPYNYEKTDFISSYPYLAKRLMDGKTLYVAFDYGYVGIKKQKDHIVKDRYLNLNMKKKILILMNC